MKPYEKSRSLYKEYIINTTTIKKIKNKKAILLEKYL